MCHSFSSVSVCLFFAWCAPCAHATGQGLAQPDTLVCLLLHVSFATAAAVCGSVLDPLGSRQQLWLLQTCCCCHAVSHLLLQGARPGHVCHASMLRDEECGAGRQDARMKSDSHSHSQSQCESIVDGRLQHSSCCCARSQGSCSVGRRIACSRLPQQQHCVTGRQAAVMHSIVRCAVFSLSLSQTRPRPVYWARLPQAVCVCTIYYCLHV